MATAWPEEESFACSVCLETLKDPTTLPCGHSYCLACIQNHWDAKGLCSCPQCRQVFNPRPVLAKSTLLAEAMEKLRTNSLKQKQNSFKTAFPAPPPSVPIYLEVLSDIGPRKGSVYPQLPKVESRHCSLHNRPLDLFCHQDRECVCEVCCQHGHRGHRVLKPQEERMERQKELIQMQAEVQRRIHESERMLKELPPAARQHKALLQALEKESSDLFPDLIKCLNQTGAGICELLGSHETAFCSQVEGLIQGLEQEVAQLHWKHEELTRMADLQDDVCFLKNFLLMEPLGKMGDAGESVLSEEEARVTSIRSSIKELQDSVQDLCKATLDKITKIVNHEPVASTPNGGAAAAAAAAVTGTAPAGYSCPATAQVTVYESITIPPPLPPPRPQVCDPPRFGGSLNHQGKNRSIPNRTWRTSSAPPVPLPLPFPRPRSQTSVRTATTVENPEPRTREEMLKFRFEPTLDPNTAYRHLKLSDDGHKITMRSENLNPPDHPERFVFWRQVLCREPLAGSPYYWEVEWTGQKITIGVAYKEMERKGSDDKSRLGHNAQSWSLYWSGTGFSFWHNNQEKLLGSPKAKRIGVYLDQHAGILNFYRIVNKQAFLIHHHETQFHGPLYPGFRMWAGIGDTLTICQLD